MTTVPTTTVLSQGGPGGMTAMESLWAIAIAAVVVFIFVAMLMVRMRVQPTRSRAPEIPQNSVEAASAYRRLTVVAAWAGGSARDWDHGVRPALSELVQLAVAERDPTGGDLREVARERLGDELWALVDPSRRRSDDRSAPGPGRDKLIEILDRVELT